MDKKTIKNRLSERFISEETTPGISVTAKANKESGKINKDGVKAIEKDVTDYEKSLTKKDKDMGKMAPNKFNYEDGFQKTYHDEMEILNGQEMLQYDSKPTKEFEEKAKEGIEGSTRMGNAKAANAEETWGASSDDFGKNLVKRVKASAKKRSEETPTLNLRGRDIQADIKDTGHRPYAIEENKTNNKNPQIKESMKRLKFNTNGDKPFEGVNLTQKLGHALTLIPESYKVDKKEFEMTDGNVTCKIRWEGNLTEGKAIVVLAKDKTLINEDMEKMKYLMGYKSSDTLGIVKGASRIDENAAFNDIWNKSKKLLGEEEDIEDADAKEGSAESLDDAVSYAPEAKKHIEGSVPTEKKTEAPEPKKGPADSLDKAKKHAPEAKKHVEGSVAEEKKTEAPAPKEGNWEEIKKKSADATKDVESGKPTKMATDKPKTVEPAKVVKENVGDEEEEEETSTDTWEKPSPDDDSADEKEPTAGDIKAEVPPMDNDDDEEDAIKVPVVKGGARLMFSKTKGEYWISVNGAMTKVPNELLAIASDTTKSGAKKAEIILQKMQDAADFGEEGGEEAGEVDEIFGIGGKNKEAALQAKTQAYDAAAAEYLKRYENNPKIAELAKQQIERSKQSAIQNALKRDGEMGAKAGSGKFIFALSRDKKNIIPQYELANAIPSTGMSQTPTT